MISISTILADTNGNLLIWENPTTKYRNGPARVTRTANLDGTTTINHGGVRDGDRTFEIVGNLTLAETDIIWHIYRSTTLVTVTTPDGAYRGAISFVDVNGGNLRMTILIKERASA